MDLVTQVQLGIVLFLILSTWGCISLIAFIKKRNINLELWATVFEGMTHKLVDLNLMKAPESFIEKKSPRNGKDKDSDDEKT